jgi:flagellar motor switch protein FliM
LIPKQARRPNPQASATPTILPCNFRSAGRLSNESARTLTSLHEVMARNLTNALDVYLGTGLEVRFNSLEQLTMDEFKTKCMNGGYMLPCAIRASTNVILLEMDNPLMFTIIDLLLGGAGAKLEVIRELTEIDEDIMEGVSALIAQEIERVVQPIGHSITPGRCIKPNAAYRIFPPTEKVLRIRFDVSIAEITGAFYVVIPASIASNLVRTIRSDQSRVIGGSGFEPLPSLRQRMLDCMFALSGEIPDLRVTVRSLASIQTGSVLTLSAPVMQPGKLTLEGKSYFEALPVRKGNRKAMQLVNRYLVRTTEAETNEDESHASA